MRILGFALTVCAALFLSACSAGSGTKKDGKDGKKAASNADKIVGTWEVTKGAEMPAGATVEFTKEGKLKATVKAGEKSITSEGTYKVEGDSLMTVMKTPEEKKETLKIKSLTDTKLVTEDEKGKTDEFKKK